MVHADKQIFLFDIGEELHIHLAEMVADHNKADSGVLCSIADLGFGEAPVYLIRSLLALWRDDVKAGIDLT